MKNKFTFKNGDVLELKAIKICEFASQETYCFEAKLYLNGKLLALVDNDGHGGSDRFANHKGSDLSLIEARLIEELPQYYLEWDDSWNDSNLEVWINEALTESLVRKDFNKLIKSKVLFVNPKQPNDIGQFSWKGVRKITQGHIDHIVGKYKDYQVLNVMPIDKAYELFYQNTQ